MKIMTVLGNNFEELEAIASIDLLKRSGIQVDIFSLNGTSVTGRSNLTLSNLLDFNQCDPSQYDGILLPGGAHYKQLEENKMLKEIILSYNKDHKLIAAICASPTILGHMGLLKDKHYTCFTSMNEDFNGYFHDQYVVSDDYLITGKSAAASVDFGLAIIHHLLGDDKANAIKEEIYY